MLRYITLNITFRSFICSILLALSFSFAQTLEVTMTAYSSEAAQTDSTPTITATGEEVGPGVVAVSRDLLNDELPYGTELRVVEVNSEANACGGWNPGMVLEVQDTMHPRRTNHVDIWVQTREEALEWGKCEAVLEVI